MKSHVQNSKFIIKKFKSTEDRKKVWIYKFENQEIFLENPQNIGVINDYYNEDTEQYLSENYETKMGEILVKLKNKTISEKDLEIIFDFFKMLVCRNPKVHEQFNEIKKTILKNYDFNLKDAQNEVILNAKKINFKKSLFNKSIKILNNNTEIPFISSITGFGCIGYNCDSTMKDTKKYNFWFPLTHNIGIFIITDELNKEFSNNLYQNIDKYMVIFLNNNIFHTAIDSNDECVFTSKKEELERLRDKKTGSR